MKAFTKCVPLFAIVLLCACSPKYNYQVFKNRSQEDKNTLAFENDQFKIEYDLWAEEGQLKIFVSNKSMVPLYLDLSQSSLIINGIAIPLYTETEVIFQTSSSNARSATYVNRYGYLETPFHSKGLSFSRAIKSSPIVYLPPKSTVVNLLLNGQLAQLYNSPDIKLRKGENKKVLAFSKEKTPYLFRLNLGYATHKNLQEMNFLDHEFWVESVIITRFNEFHGDAIKSSNTYSMENFTLPYKNKKAFYVKYRANMLKK